MTRRTEQIGEAVREEVANIIAHGLKDPRIGFVTITRAEVTPDLRHARILFGVLGDAAQRDKTEKGLKQAAGFIRREVGKRLRLRFTPELTSNTTSASTPRTAWRGSSKRPSPRKRTKSSHRVTERTRVSTP